MYMMQEEVAKLLKGGDPSSSNSTPNTVIRKMLEHLINAELKSEYFNVILPSGETIPDGLVLATYEGVAVDIIAPALLLVY